MAILLAVAGWSLIFLGDKEVKDDNPGGKGAGGETALINLPSEKDSDADGLKDWEESLWKTDKNNPDTDGDGTLDGDEVKLSRNPAKAGPNDEFKNELAATPPPPENYEKISMTDSLSRSLLLGYLSAKQSGGESLGDAEKNNLVDSLLSGLSETAEREVYGISDLKISRDEGEEPIRRYGNRLGAIMEKYSYPNPPGMEIYIFKKSIEAGNEGGLKEIEKSVAVYEGLIKDCLALEVPADLADAHLGLVNVFSRNKEMSVDLMNFSGDPLASVMALKNYYGTQEDMINSFVFVKKYFAANGVFFAKDEPAYFIIGQLK